MAAVMPDDVQLVRFGADFVFCSRSVSDFDSKESQAIAWIYKHCRTTGETGNPNVDQFGNYCVEHIARHMTYDYLEGEDWETTFDRHCNRS